MGWKLSPVLLLLLMSCMNMLIYIDRGVIGSNGVNGSEATDQGPGTGIQGDFGITNALDGFLPGAFMVGLLVSSPIFAECSKHYNGFRLIAVGLGTWTLACVACSLAPSFATLVVCRMFVGVGEASFVALAAPFIDDNAPPGSKTKWLAVFYLCIPTGYALGYIFGGLVAGPLGWRGPFLLEAAAMLPFVLFCSFAPPLDIKGTKEEANEDDSIGVEKPPRSRAVREFAADLATLWKHPVYCFSILGSTLYTGVIGAYAYLGPKSGRETFHIPGETADLTFGAITVLTGIFGTLLGGILLDLMGSGVQNALIICASCTFLGCITIVGSFVLASSLAIFSGPFALGQLFLFGIQAPQNAVVLWSVPPRLRPFAISMSIVLTHVLGDVPSPTMLGWLQDRIQNWRLSMAVCTFFLLPSAVFYFVAKVLAGKQQDYRQQEVGDADEEINEELEAPLV